MQRAGLFSTMAMVAVVALGGCSSERDDSSDVVVVTVTSTPGAQDPQQSAAPGQPGAPGAQSAQTGSQCSGLGGREAAVKWAPQVPTVNGWAWDADHAYVDDYDQCAALSSIVLPIERGTSSSPYAIMLFHGGEYIGTATAEPEGFAPAVEKISDSAIEVTYRYPNDGDSNANPSGRAVSQFTWDPQQNRVVHTGQLPSDARNSGGGGSSSGSAANPDQVGGECGTVSNGWKINAGDHASCGLAMATVDSLMKVGPPAPNHITDPFPVVSPSNGQSYMMTCSGGSDARAIMCAFGPSNTGEYVRIGLK